MMSSSEPSLQSSAALFVPDSEVVAADAFTERCLPSIPPPPPPKPPKPSSASKQTKKDQNCHRISTDDKHKAMSSDNDNDLDVKKDHGPDRKKYRPNEDNDIEEEVPVEKSKVHDVTNVGTKDCSENENGFYDMMNGGGAISASNEISSQVRMYKKEEEADDDVNKDDNNDDDNNDNNDNNDNDDNDNKNDDKNDDKDKDKDNYCNNYNNGEAKVMDDHDDDEEDDDEDDNGGCEEDEDEDDHEELMELIRSAAESQGIPLEWFIRNSSALAAGITGESDDEYIDDDYDGPLEYPFGDTLPKNLHEIAQFIKSDKCRSILILAGAGMSVSAGIPDFRSANGLYATLNPDLLTACDDEKDAIHDDPTVALEHSMFLQNPFPLLELQREFILGTYEQRWKATIAHRFVELLYTHGNVADTSSNKLARWYTQNIDGLEDQCLRIPREKVIAVHGSMDRAECERCHSEMDFNDFCRFVRTNIKDLSGQDGTAPKESSPIPCPTCGCNSVKPSIVLFRSSLPKVFFESVPKDVHDVDLLIVMGTSLRVAPANSLVRRVPRTCLRLLINREEVGDHLGMIFQNEGDGDEDEDENENDDDDKVDHDDGNDEKDDNSNDNRTARQGSGDRDYFAKGDCDAVLLELIEHLGWLDDLKPLLDEHKLPESCSRLLREKLETFEKKKKAVRIS